MHKTKSILRRIQGRPDNKYNILTFNTHERYQTNQCLTGHNFYAFNWEQGKDWFTEHAPIPENYYQMPMNSYFPGIEFDFIIAHSKFGQLQVAKQLQMQLQVPILCLEHTLPLEQWPQTQLEQFQNFYGDVNVFITEYSKNKWNINAPSDVIYHGVDTDLFKPIGLDKVRDMVERNGVLTVAHDFIKRDYALNYQGWERITQGLERKVVGDTEGLSRAAENIDELVCNYQKALVYINPSVLSPVPTSMLEAMACGCPVVSMHNCDIPEFVEHGVNGYLSNDELELRQFIEKLLDNPDLAIDMGKAARKTVLEKCSKERFISEWNNIFDKTYEVIK